jgi:AhpD family alkylhydroperoxidase
MKPRVDYKASPDAVKALLNLEKVVRNSGLETSLLDVIRMRASQINGCAYCLDMHSKDARAHGETKQRLYALNAWHETPFYTDRERAALAWTEALTRIADTHAPDEVFEQLREQFNEKEIMDVTLAIGAINTWNRIAIGFRLLPGEYQPPHKRQPATADV